MESSVIRTHAITFQQFWQLFVWQCVPLLARVYLASICSTLVLATVATIYYSKFYCGINSNLSFIL